MTPFTEEENTWIATYWLAGSHQRPSGLYDAILLANNVFARLSMDQVMHEAKASALTYRVFDVLVSTQAWLRQSSLVTP